MATTLAQIEQLFDAAGLVYQAHPERDLLVSNFRLPGGRAMRLLVMVEEAGEMVRLIVPQVLMLGNHPQRDQVMELLVALGMQIKLVRWQYDPSDGEVRAAVDVPVEDGALLVADEMNSVYAGSELSDFLEKARSKGVIFAFGQQSSGGNTDLRLNAAMSNNTRIQIVFSGCKQDDPQVQELNAVAGRYTPKLDPRQDEPGFVDRECLPIDSIMSLGPLASLIRIKSVLGVDRIMWLSQNNALVPHRSRIRAIRDHLANAIYHYHQRGATSAAEFSSLSGLYAHAKQLLLYSYGYWRADELQQALSQLNLDEISQSYNRTMRLLEQRNQKAHEILVLDQSRPEFQRGQLAALILAMQERQWQVQHYIQTTTEARIFESIRQSEEWLWNQFLAEFLPQIQKHRFFLDPNPIKKPKLRWFNALIGVHFPEQFGSHIDAVLRKYQEYAERYGRKRPDLWQQIEPLVRLRVSGEYTVLDTVTSPMKPALSSVEMAKQFLEG